MPARAEPNVTPMIDVLMVLLIIFMVIAPLSRRAVDVQLPAPTDKVLVVRGDERATYADVVAAIDSARGAGVKVVGLDARR